MKLIGLLIVAAAVNLLALRIFGGVGVIVVSALPLALSLYLLDRVEKLEEKLAERKQALEAEQAAEQAQQAKEEQLAQERLEQEMLEQVVEAELAQESGKE